MINKLKITVKCEPVAGVQALKGIWDVALDH